MKKKILVTGFEPFDGAEENPSWEAVRRLPDTDEEWELRKICLPVLYEKAADRVIAFCEDWMPDYILCAGLAGSRKAVTPETLGGNIRTLGRADEGGFIPQDLKIDPKGPDFIISPLPEDAMSDRLNAAGIRAYVSPSAGAFVCNDLFYPLLRRFGSGPPLCGFVHLPPAEVLSFPDGARALLLCIDEMIHTKKEDNTQEE